MKKVITTAAFLLTATLVGPQPLEAQYYWACIAESPYARGVGQSINRHMAIRIALNECSMRTPVGSSCRLIACY